MARPSLAMTSYPGISSTIGIPFSPLPSMRTLLSLGRMTFENVGHCFADKTFNGSILMFFWSGIFPLPSAADGGFHRRE
jgi:hypothetical protein